MRYILKMITSLAIVIGIVTADSSLGHSQPNFGQVAPVFSLNDVDGKQHDLSKMKNRPIIILYFFDVESETSQEGLLSLDQLTQKHAGADLNVWGITRSAKETVSKFISRSGLRYPILLDTSNVCDLYNARFVLPTIYILGPKLKVKNQIQGGGDSTEIMLTRLAENQLQRKKYPSAQTISKHVEKSNSQNIQAKMVKVWSEIKTGRLEAAERTCRKLSQSKGQEEILGKECLASIFYMKGQTERAQPLADELVKIAPDRVHAYMVLGDILYRKGRKKQASVEYKKAVQTKSGADFQKAEAHDKFGRLQASLGNLQQARELYDQAVAIDPYLIEATTNKGMTYEKEGNWDKALDAYREALVMNKDDVFAEALAKRAQTMVRLQNDVARKNRMDKLVQRLAKRFRKLREIEAKEDLDEWTSRPMIMSFVDFQEKGGMSERNGFSSVLMIQLSDQINSSGRVQAVERILIERLLEELNLGSSEVANPETALKLGKVLAARIIGTGSLHYFPSGTLMSLRLIDTETTEYSKVVTRQFAPGVSLKKELHRLNREILSAIIKKYPLRGFVVQASQDRIMINLGSKQGVSKDIRFEVLKEQEPIKYKGKLLISAPKTIAELQVVQVEPDLCYARILTQEDTITRDDKVQEKVDI